MNLRDVLVGLLLGDLCAQKRSVNGNTNLHFEQGFLHKDYIFHLYCLFKDYCSSDPKITDRQPDKRTGKVYTRIQFVTYSLPCFNEIYLLFYPYGKKLVPSNIGEYLTPIGLAYWICDDGYFDKKGQRILLSTDSYSLEEVNILLGVLSNKFNLSCYANKHGEGYTIAIAKKSLPILQTYLEPIMPSMMRSKLGLSEGQKLKPLPPKNAFTGQTASLQTQNGGKTYRMKFEWGEKSKRYLDHVYSLFGEWVLSEPHKKTRISPKGNEVINWGFQTISHVAFCSLAILFINKKKVIPADLIKNHLTPRGLAYWFMDDGGKLDYNKNSKNKGVVFNTQSFESKEVKAMAQQLSEKFNLDCEIRSNKGKKIIVIKSSSYSTFLSLIDSYILPEMRYKLP